MKVNVNRRHKSIGRGISLRSGRLGRIFARYRDARKSMRVSISRQSQRGLDWMNFFLADVQTGFGAFVAFYLADLGWPKDQVGLAALARWLASSARPRAERLSMQSGGNEVWSRSVLA